jgi:hypothetical protein
LTKAKFKVSSVLNTSYFLFNIKTLRNFKILYKNLDKKMISSRAYFLILLIFLIPATVSATHTGNRYSIFLEKPELYVTKQRSFIDVSVFYATASTACKRYGGTCGIPELYGSYDLKDVISSLQKTNPGKYIGDNNPIYEVTGSHELDGKKLDFGVTGKINTAGLILAYEQNLKFANLKNITFGIWLPVMNSDIISRFDFNNKKYKQNYGKFLSNSEVEKVDEIRRITHKEIGFEGTNISRSGVGDIDVHLRGNYFLDHKLMMRGIDLNLQGGVIIPTGRKMNIDYPASTPFMNDGHWGVYLDFVPEFELKQDLKVGLILGGLWQFDDTQNRRVAVYKEPSIYSAMVGKIEIDPGSTFKISPYLTLENLSDGAHIQLRYTYLRHSMDKWRDKRDDKSIDCYLETTPRINPAITHEDLEKNLSEKNQLSKWRAHYFTIQAAYDSKLALKNWFMNPKFYASYDMPINGNGFCKTHLVTLGAQLFF